MKNLIATLLVFFMLTRVFSQKVKIADLKTPNSPGFQILDIAPSSVERPTNPKEFSLKVINLVGNGNAIPKNFAFEFSPFWFLKNKKENVYDYLNINFKAPDKSFFGTGILTKFSFSIASTFADSTNGSLLKNTNYVAIGARTNLFTFRSAAQNKRMSAAILAAAVRQGELSKMRADGTRPPLDSIEILIDKDTVFQNRIKILQCLPLIQLDGAYAYSNAFQGNEYSGRRFNRSGFWATLSVNAQFKQNDHYLCFIGVFKASNDNVLMDTVKNIFNSKTFSDYGGKIEYNLKKFNFSIEYLKRNYRNLTSINTERTAGILQYKINDNLYVLATFGQNFGKVNNVFTLLGLNWGFGNSPLSLDK